LAFSEYVAQIRGATTVNASLAEVVTHRRTELRDTFAALMDDPSAHDTAEVAFAALIGYAALTATETTVDHHGFRQALPKLLV
jgi:chorismate mutase